MEKNAIGDKIDVPKSDFKDLDNLGQCECGNWAHHAYLRHDDDSGASSCPSCMMSYLSEIISKMTKLVKEIADPELTSEDIVNMIKRKYCEIYGVDDIDLDDEFWYKMGIED